MFENKKINPDSCQAYTTHFGSISRILSGI
jgi:hypothetical protein